MKKLTKKGTIDGSTICAFVYILLSPKYTLVYYVKACKSKADCIDFPIVLYLFI